MGAKVMASIWVWCHPSRVVNGLSMAQERVNISRKCRLFQRLGIVLWLAVSVSGCKSIDERFSVSRPRCPSGLKSVRARCCAPGQTVIGGHCSGQPQQCPPDFKRSTDGRMGCVARNVPVFVTAGPYVVGPNDWESEHVPLERGHVEGFWLDSTEVSWERFYQCIVSGACALRTDPRGGYEPGQPVTKIEVEAARTFCAWAKGRLPVRREWLRATAGEKSYRFPWGQTGLVCRRAVYGLVLGPCAEGGDGPEIAGARPDGRSPFGIFDLVGNVAELVDAEAGQVQVRGGSFRSDHAAVLKSWSFELYRGPRDDIGFRCAYDRDPRLL